MLPDQASRARGWVRQGAGESGRSAPIVASYVRVAVGPGAAQRLHGAERFYRTINEAHRKHFAAMDAPFIGAIGDPGRHRGAIDQPPTRRPPGSEPPT